MVHFVSIGFVAGTVDAQEKMSEIIFILLNSDGADLSIQLKQ